LIAIVLRVLTLVTDFRPPQQIHPSKFKSNNSQAKR
jgi:hypothetical protein